MGIVIVKKDLEKVLLYKVTSCKGCLVSWVRLMGGCSWLLRCRQRLPLRPCFHLRVMQWRSCVYPPATTWVKVRRLHSLAPAILALSSMFSSANLRHYSTGKPSLLCCMSAHLFFADTTSLPQQNALYSTSSL